MSESEQRRRRGNPDWGKPVAVRSPDTLTEFEMHVKKLGLRQGEYVESPRLRSWCERHRNQFYIPEWLLKEWGIEVDGFYGSG